uniref:NADH-ubiquinone oxidoreductase chain 2 n=1 Tax=Corythucha marmorata TaxID=621227 RepID=A0A515KYY3_9HEMI|nr:NADH dehydrogenase subunit 2 [Corythucha marmorata]QDM37009.1 NADH dehydrogenase subunit 2 [Corythucha marmorata]
MKMFNKKIFFLTMMMLSTLMVLSSSKWLMMWMSMEVNLMMTVPFIFQNKSKELSEKVMMYFLMQVMASMLFLVMIMLQPFINNLTLKMIMSMSMMMKLGLPPFHLWMPEMMNKLDWITLMVMITLQKINPLMVMTNMMENNMLMSSIMIMASTIGSLGGINQVSLNKIIVFSSINHMSWIIMCMLTKNSLWMKYFIVYLMMTMTLCMLLNKSMVSYINQLNLNTNNTKKMSLLLMMLNMGGLPPMPGFFIKWMTIDSMTSSVNLYFITIIMLMTSMIALLFYMRLTVNFMMMSTSMNKFSLLLKNKYNYLLLLMNMILPMMMLI